MEQPQVAPGSGDAAVNAAALYDPSRRWREGIQSAAQAGNVGNLFQYAIATPVSLPRQQSAMLPIVNADVKGEKVSTSTTPPCRPSTRSTGCGSPTPPTCT